jgi:hypothetical protein
MSPHGDNRRYTEPPVDDVELIIFGTKQCRGCDRELPASRDYFNSDRHTCDGLTLQCRCCRAASNKRYDLRVGRRRA